MGEHDSKRNAGGREGRGALLGRHTLAVSPRLPQRHQCDQDNDFRASMITDKPAVHLNSKPIWYPAMSRQLDREPYMRYYSQEKEGDDYSIMKMCPLMKRIESKCRYSTRAFAWRRKERSRGMVLHIVVVCHGSFALPYTNK